MALNFRSLAVTVVTLFLAACTCAYPTELVESPANLTSRQDVSADAFYFYGYDGCNTPDHPDWSSAILEAWDEVLAIGGAVTSDVDWSSDAAGDFLGSKDNNQAYQTEIQNILKNIQTWKHDGTRLAWSIEARCDDYLRRPELDCPEGTKPEDEYKCNSRCYRARFTRDSSGKQVLLRWDDRAAAYTTNHGGTAVATINFCPSFFAMDTCEARINKSGKSTTDREKLHMINYQCRGYAALHELFHINSMAHRVAYRVPHVYDRKFQIYSPNAKGLVTLNAYGAEYTKTLARWTTNTGWWVATNADNLAQYALAMWVTSRIGAYPYYPVVSEKPATDPFAVGTLDNAGTISLTDDAVALGEALGVAPEDAYDTYVSGNLSCSDAGDDGTTVDPCVDEVNNAPADLLPVTPGVPLTTLVGPDPTSTPAPTPTPSTPADFNCNCGESGCSADSMPCCANGSCQCHCTESGCAAEDPSCCASGTCHI